MFAVHFKILRAKPLPLAGFSLPVAPMGKGLMAMRSFSTTMSAFRALTPKPKQPLPAYHFYVNDLIASPNFSTPSGRKDASSISVVAAPMWRALSLSERAPYDAAADAARAEYDRDYAKWYNALTPQEIKDFEALTGGVVLPPGGGAKRRKKAVSARPGYPGKPMGPFLMFQAEMKKKGLLKVEEIEDKMQMMRNLSTEASKMWNKLSDEEKDRWTVASAEAKKKYDAWAATQPDLVAQDKRDKLDTDDQKRHLKYLKNMPGAPKFPTSAWLNFCDAVRARGGVPVPPEIVGAEVAQYKSKKMGEMWRKLKPDQRAPYDFEFESDRRAWKAWEAKHPKD
ncbi:hypothetical protein IAT38_001161 [Cryptococcus sp. DSM 104549]